MRKGIKRFIIEITSVGILIVSVIVFVNVTIDASFIIKPQNDKLAKAALEGNAVVTPANINERDYQYCIINNMQAIPDTIVVGSSRGMYLGKDITKEKNIYNHCVSGGTLEDFYSVIGLYYEKFRMVPKNLILEISPWVLNANSGEARWTNNRNYELAAKELYKMLNGKNLEANKNDIENPYFSIPYFQYNCTQFLEKGDEIFIQKNIVELNIATTSIVYYPDGTVRYALVHEESSPERTLGVQKIKGVHTYQNGDTMQEPDKQRSEAIENLIQFLLNEKSNIIIYLAPFSPTQCRYSFDENLNPFYNKVQEYIKHISEKYKIQVIGGYDSRKFGLTDDYFRDNMHPDKRGTEIVWNYNE